MSHTLLVLVVIGASVYAVREGWGFPVVWLWGTALAEWWLIRRHVIAWDSGLVVSTASMVLLVPAWALWVRLRGRR